MATTQDLARAEAELERADGALNDARSAVLRAERRLNLAREAGPDVDPGLLAEATQNLSTAQRNLQAADAAYTAAQQNFQTIFDAVDDTAAPQADPEVRQVEAEAQPQDPPLAQVQFQPDPVEPEEDPVAASIIAEENAVDSEEVETVEPDPVTDDPQNSFVFNEDGELVPADSVEAEQIIQDQRRIENAEAVVPLNYSVTFEDGFDWVIVDNDTGTFVETGFATQAEADAALARLTGEGLGFTGEVTPDDIAETNTDTDDPDADAAAITQAAADRARAQAVIDAQRKQANEGDWRVKLRLAGGANYLYRDPALANPQSGILYPLSVTDGVVFPYTPIINTNYGANYNAYDLTHSNLRGYFYQNSYVDEISIQAVFTAQDTSEASYLLAVIHFFRSVTKMFYGQDNQRGTPPPLVFLQGLGEYQFNLHPCVVKTFTYNLPNDVDYIRCRSVNINGTNLQQRRDLSAQNTGPANLSSSRLSAAGITPGALQQPPPPSTLGTNRPTYVPTRMEMTITLLPIQTRSQISQQFSVKQYANGDLLKGGFW